MLLALSVRLLLIVLLDIEFLRCSRNAMSAEPNPAITLAAVTKVSG